MLEVSPANAPLSGVLQPPGDKSISHRALILSALADGNSVITGLLLGEDVLATKSALEQLGATFNWQEDRLHVTGLGESGLKSPGSPLGSDGLGACRRSPALPTPPRPGRA